MVAFVVWRRSDSGMGETPGLEQRDNLVQVPACRGVHHGFCQVAPPFVEAAPSDDPHELFDPPRLILAHDRGLSHDRADSLVVPIIETRKEFVRSLMELGSIRVEAFESVGDGLPHFLIVRASVGDGVGAPRASQQ